MELDRLKILVERYLEAETTLDEERELADIFAAGEDIPEEYEPVRAMFQTFDAIKEQSAPNIAPPVADEPKVGAEHKRRWWLLGGVTTIAAAACLVVMLTPPTTEMEGIAKEHRGVVAEGAKLVCHIDGKMVTNESVAYQEANKILGGVANNMQVAMAEIEKFNIIIGR
jgi:hypothetical protein